MKHFLWLLVILFSVSLSAQQQLDTLSHKHQMIDAINKGDYNLALQHLALVENWDFDPDVDPDWVEVDSALIFVDYISEEYLFHDFLIYLGQKC